MSAVLLVYEARGQLDEKQTMRSRGFLPQSASIAPAYRLTDFSGNAVFTEPATKIHEKCFDPLLKKAYSEQVAMIAVIGLRAL
jgi:hypothetical protein